MHEHFLELEMQSYCPQYSDFLLYPDLPLTPIHHLPVYVIRVSMQLKKEDKFASTYV